MTPDIRLATRADLAAVQQIVEAAYACWIPRLGRRPGPMLDDYRALIEAGRVHVADRDGTVLGVLVLIPESGALLLDNIAVIPEAQGTGVGRAMFEHAERAAAEAGFGSIRLYTNEAMAENIALYRRIGYAETHRATEKGLHRVYMRKQLGTLEPPLA